MSAVLSGRTLIQDLALISLTYENRRNFVPGVDMDELQIS